MSYITAPELIAILWLAIVLARLRRWQANDLIHLWITGLFLFVVEGIARILYLMPLSPGLHSAMHVIALDAYFLAGVAFFQSATGRLRLLPYNNSYLFICTLPHVLLLTMYGSNLYSRPPYLVVAVAGLLASLVAAALLRRSWLNFVCQGIVWVPIIGAAYLGGFRWVAYLSLFFAYLATAIAFLLTLPRERKGRAVVVAGFCVWSLCFITHPWLAQSQPYWVPLAERVWNLQKFFVMFGLLIVSLEEYSATNEYQALHDTLTGLANRRLFDDRLEQALARSHRNHSRVVLFNMDLECFKQVNDTLGHDAGDELLCEVGRRLLAVTRETDTLARMGGDEFYLVINDFNAHAGADDEIGGIVPMPALREQSRRLAENFRHAVESEPFRLTVDGTEHILHLKVSIGCVVFPDEAGNRTDLCRLADQNMYSDKKRRGTVALEMVAVGATD